MKLYKKIKTAYDNYVYKEDRCLGCPSSIFLEYILPEEGDLQHRGGCGDIWKKYARKNHPEDPDEWFKKKTLSRCDGCKVLALKLSKDMCGRIVKI